MKKRICLILCAVFGALLFAGEYENPADRYAQAYKKYLDAPLPITSDSIRNFVYFARDRQSMRDHALLENPRFSGAQIMYAWAQLEPSKDTYDFSAIREDYEYLAAHGKKLFVQLQDATFNPQFKGIPDYLFAPEYDGGAAIQRTEDGRPEGWVAKRWNENVRQRFALLLSALGAEFDGKIEGINLQETAIGVSQKDDPSFTPAGYAAGIKSTMLALKKAFPRSATMQYANFMPDEWLPWDDKGYLRSIYAYGQEIGVGMGAPDLMVQKRGQLNHALAMLHENSYTVPLGIAVQDGNYIGLTNSDKVVTKRKNLVPLLYAFAEDFLKVNYIFWSNQQPYFEEDVLSALPPR